MATYRPKIKKGTELVDLPLDAETLQGKTLEEIALKTDIPTFKTINGQSITGEGDITIEGGSGDSSITDLGTVNSLDDVALDVTEIGFYKFKLSKTGGAHLTACFMQVGLYYGDFTQLVLYTNEGDGKIRSAFRMKNSPTSEWSSWEYNNYMSDNYLGPINYQQNGPNKEVFLILGVTKNRDSLYPNGRERGVLLYFRGNGYETTTWAVIKYYTDYSTHKFYFTAVRIDDAESLTILEAKDIPYLEELTTSSITEEMYTTYTYAKSTDIPTKTSQLENDSGYAKQEDLNNYLPLSGGTMTGDIDMGYNNISGIKYIDTTDSDSDSYTTYAFHSIEHSNSSGDTYIYTFPEKDGTIALLEDLQGGGSGGVSEEDVLQIIEDNSSNTSQMDVDTSISIGTSADYNPNSDTQIPTTKAVQEMINVGGGSGSGSGSGSGNYLPLSGGTMSGNIEMPEYKGIVDSSEHSGFIFYGNYPAIANTDNPFVLCMTDDTADGSEAHYYTFPNYDGKVVVKNSNGDIILNNEAGDDTYLIISADDTGLGDYPYIKMYHYGDSIYYGVHFITKETNNKLYTYTFPEKNGTIALTEDIVTESRVNELIAAYMSANYDNGDEGSY